MIEAEAIALNSGGAAVPPVTDVHVEYPPSQEHPFVFNGNAQEYFRIWIVNIFLSIITLGIYSAWAKVRKLRYLYGNTTLDGAAFEYTADPLKILKGRIIAVVALAIFSSSQTIPVLYGILLVLIFLAVPWLVIKSRMFNLANTRHRNVRFNFHSTYAKAAFVFILGPIVAYVTLGLGYPWYVARKSKFIVDNSRFGTSPMNLNTQAGQFYTIFFMLLITTIAALFVFGVVFGIGAMVISAVTNNSATDVKWLAILPIIILSFVYIGYFIGARSYLQAAVGNLIWNNASLGQHRFQSTLKISSLLWINLVNTLAIVFSFGLMIPWATIRSLRYRIENISLVAHGSLDDIAAAESQKLGAMGEEISDFFDVDIGL
jgi:uncharacterized membrane protein YjgN (DUF898 family)